jgi:flagellar basal-body rod protein FlgC
MNLANAKTTRTPQGGPYRRRSVLQQTADVDDPFSIHMRSALDREVKGVRVMAVTIDNRPLKRVYEPGHPDADAEGYVSYPDINVVEEMANLMTAQRNYEANVTTAEALKGMYVKALEIGK